MQQFRIASLSIRLLLANPIRTVPACVAIAVGVLALELMIGTGTAAQLDLRARLRGNDASVVVVQNARYVPRDRHGSVAAPKSLTMRDVEAIRNEVATIAGVSPLVETTQLVKHGRHGVSMSVLGIEPLFFRAERITLSEGRALTETDSNDSAPVTILGKRATTELYSSDPPVGTTVDIAGVPFIVVGIAGVHEQSLMGRDFDRLVFVPFRSMVARLSGQIMLDSIYVQSRSPEETSEVERRVTTVLRRTHELATNHPDDFVLQNRSELIRAERGIGGALRRLTAGIAVVTLPIGVVGVFATMWLAVRQRVREIGLRRAVGATRMTVLRQFVFESAVITGIGGLTGAVLGLCATWLVCELSGWPRVFPLVTAAIATISAIVVGVACGIAPAMKASRLDAATAVKAAV